MSNLTKRIPVIVKKLDGAIEALAELRDLTMENDTCHAGDSRMQLSVQLREFALSGKGYMVEEITMQFFTGEQDAVKVVCDAGKQFGYGNMIDRLKIAWVLHLKEGGCSWAAAAVGSLLDEDRVKGIVAAAKKDETVLVKWMKEYTGQVLSD